MDFHMNHNHITASPSSSSSSSTPNLNFTTTTNTTNNNTTSNTSTTNTTTTNNDPMHSWWESISKARSRIHCLSSILPSSSLSSLADSDRPARSLIDSHDAYAAFSDCLSAPFSGSGSDPLCQWLYETFQSSDPDLRLVVFSFVPLLSGLYLSRVISNASDSATSLAGFEAVLLALYAAETKARAGKPVLISIPDLSLPSLYHAPRGKIVSGAVNVQARPYVGILSDPLEPQNAVKSTKRACIVGVALDCYYKHISQMPSWSKVDLCEFAAAWAGQDCPCKGEFDNEIDINGFSDGRVMDGGEDEIDDDVVSEMNELRVRENSKHSCQKGARIPLPWELLQPVLRILGHCLLGPLNSNDVKDAASVAVRCLYARSSHDLVPQAILATRSLIQLDKRSRASAKMAAAANASSNANTPSKAKKPEVLLVSK